jgi:hypothetical protein
MADKSQSDEKSSMSKASKDFFDAGQYDKALEILQKLAKMTSNDAKVMHNIAVCEHYKNGFCQPQKQLQALRNIKSKMDERHGEQVSPPLALCPLPACSPASRRSCPGFLACLRWFARAVPEPPMLFKLRAVL